MSRQSERFNFTESAQALSGYATEMRHLVRTILPADDPKATEYDARQWKLVAEELDRCRELLDRMTGALVEIDGR